MNARPRDYKVDPDSETARLLREATDAPIQVDTGDKVYQLSAAEMTRSYDSQRMIRAIRASAGALRDVDTTAPLQVLRSERRQRSTSRSDQ
jgi:hypothetical protein